jgi:hypothetical protein
MYDLITNLYSNSVNSVTPRKTIAKLQNNETMTITFVTIFNSSKESDLHMQTMSLKKEGDELIKSRMRTIKTEFKNVSSRNLNTKKISQLDSFETLTVSPFSPLRKLKFSLTYVYQVK